MSQYLTEDVLRDHLAKFGVHVELSTELVSLEQDNKGVTVALKKTGADGSETMESVRAAYVIGADGARGAIVCEHDGHPMSSLTRLCRRYKASYRRDSGW